MICILRWGKSYNLFKRQQKHRRTEYTATPPHVAFINMQGRHYLVCTWSALDCTWAGRNKKPSLFRNKPQTSLKLQVHNLLSLSSPGFGWQSGPPPLMTHRSPHGSFCSGWACSLRAGSLPAAACHTCPGCPGTVSVLPS